MEITAIQPISFTEGAITELKRLMAAEDFNATQKLRIGVKGGGCSGLSYLIGFDEEQKEGDIIFDFEGITCIMQKAHELYLYGMEIDWQNGLNNRGFTFTNPNASSTCGCGTSFAV